MTQGTVTGHVKIVGIIRSIYMGRPVKLAVRSMILRRKRKPDPATLPVIYEAAKQADECGEDEQFKFDVESKVTASPCYKCGKMLDACTGPSSPKPGDHTICAYCGAHQVFGEDLILREPNKEERKLAESDPYLKTALQTVEVAIKKLSKPPSPSPWKH